MCHSLLWVLSKVLNVMALSTQHRSRCMKCRVVELKQADVDALQRHAPPVLYNHQVAVAVDHADGAAAQLHRIAATVSIQRLIR